MVLELSRGNTCTLSVVSATRDGKDPAEGRGGNYRAQWVEEGPCHGPRSSLS